VTQPTTPGEIRTIIGEQNMSEQVKRLSPAMEREMLATVPRLRAFARSLCGNRDRADDLVQDTMVRAITHIDRFQPGTNLGAWMATILRNQFLSDTRKRRKEVEDMENRCVARMCSTPEQEGCLELEDVRAAMAKLKFNEREALLLVGAAGFSYDDIALVFRTNTGTIKSRIHRGRLRLAAVLATMWN
jgi:RNA polymerase sigma-70 factor (ECF subfamily)